VYVSRELSILVKLCLFSHCIFMLFIYNLPVVANKDFHKLTKL